MSEHIGVDLVFSEEGKERIKVGFGADGVSKLAAEFRNIASRIERTGDLGRCTWLGEFDSNYRRSRGI